jgi:hypothetical protein
MRTPSELKMVSTTPSTVKKYAPSHGVEEVHEGGQVRAALLHGVEHGLARDG